MKCGKMKIKTPTAMMNKPKPHNTGFLRGPPVEADERSEDQSRKVISTLYHAHLETVETKNSVLSAKA